MSSCLLTVFLVITGHHFQAGLVSLNRPKALNALNGNMVTLITEQLVKWSTDPSIETVLVEGSSGLEFVLVLLFWNHFESSSKIKSEVVIEIFKNLLKYKNWPSLPTFFAPGGEKAFCAGGDVVSLTNGTTPDPLQFFNKEFQMNHFIGRYNSILSKKK